jgi:serine/threonine protein kinase
MQLPGYVILEELGRGGMGVVYKARQVHLDRLVALKTILAGIHAGQEAAARFRIEAQAAARLDHPNIVRVYDFGEHEGLAYFSMELIPGQSLVRHMGGQPWPAGAAVQLTRTLALAIHHAHEQKIIHRDLKPANVLVRNDGVPKITDFGLAKRLDSRLDLTGTGQILGSARYMAPEQAAGNLAEIGPATDVHALGATLYELLTGRPAFGGTTLLEALEQIRSSDPVPPRVIRPDVPAEVEAVCLRCLRKDPKSRYGTAKELAEELRNLRVESPGPEAAPPAVLGGDRGDGGDRAQWWRV